MTESNEIRAKLQQAESLIEQAREMADALVDYQERVSMLKWELDFVTCERDHALELLQEFGLDESQLRLSLAEVESIKAAIADVLAGNHCWPAEAS